MSTYTLGQVELTTKALEWADLWAAMKRTPYPWVPTTEHMFDEMLGAVPPTDMGAGGFLVGEADHKAASGDDVFACFVAHADGSYEARYMTQLEFDAWKAIRQLVQVAVIYGQIEELRNLLED